MNQLITSTVAFLILSLSGCATTDTLTDEQKNDAYAKYIIDNELESIKSIRSFSFRGWGELTNQYLVLSSAFNKRYLIQLKGNCFDLSEHNPIATKQTMTGRLSINSDSIMVLNGSPVRCFIKSIYPIDNIARQELRAIGKPVPEQG